MPRIRIIPLVILCALPLSAAAQRPGRKPPQAAPAAPADYNPPPPLSGRFRVTITGLRATSQTLDHQLEVDGKGDEVYLRADRWVIGNDGRVRERRTFRTPVMGDVNRQQGRVQAGGASDLGGIRTGDQYPSLDPWRQTGPGSEERLPLVIWEGEMTNHQEAVVIIPTIWEWDGPDQVMRDWEAHVSGSTPYGQEMVGALLRRVFRYGGLVDPVYNWPLVGQLEPTAQTAFRIAYGGANDRPIGVCNAPRNGERIDSYCGPVLFLTRTIADQAARARSSLGPGVVTLQFRDAVNGLFGDYTLLLHVERL